VKGKGVSFMERSAALAEGGGFYKWHAGAPGDDDFERARDELVERIGAELEELGLEALELVSVAAPQKEARYSLEGEPESGAGAALHKVTEEYVVEAYGEALVELGATNDRLVVLDADLASDCRVRGFELAFPDRFVECGIAEQDMVSTAAGLARHGFLPVVNSFASFLASRANEQIYNQASEGSKVVYALHYAGLIPAGPGKSHQSLRDISLLAALPNMTIVQPCSPDETRALLRWAIEDAEENVAIRLAIGPSPRHIELPATYEPTIGRGSRLRAGEDAVILAYGPVLLHEALLASERLGENGIQLAVVNMPWLDHADPDWLTAEIAPYEHVLVLDDHAPVGGLGDTLRRALHDRLVTVYGVEGWPACGTPEEVLAFHELDGASLARRIAVLLGAR
jgi:transketolase